MTGYLDGTTDPVAGIPDGFPGERLVVLPWSIARDSLRAPVTAQLTVTDCGYFPAARDHAFRRPHGAEQAIVIVCTSGSGWVEFGDDRHQVIAGQVVVLPRGVPHAYGSGSETPWTLWWLHVAGDAVDGLVAAGRLAAGGTILTVGDTAQLQALIDEALTALEQDATRRSQLAASGAAWHLLCWLAAADDTADASSPAERASAYLREHLAEETSMADLARHVRLSPSRCAAVFRTRYAVSPMRYLTQLRMAKARTLLDRSQLRVHEIAASVGYRDPFYFSRQFSKLHGMTPRAYRNHRKG